MHAKGHCVICCAEGAGQQLLQSQEGGTEVDPSGTSAIHSHEVGLFWALGKLCCPYDTMALTGLRSMAWMNLGARQVAATPCCVSGSKDAFWWKDGCLL